MSEQNILQCKSRHEFRAWLMEHAEQEMERWVEVSRGRPDDDSVFWYLDAVEEALCFGWIDSTHRLIEGRRMQRFTPRKKNSPWTELNKERVRRLERMGLMTDAGRRVLPLMGELTEQREQNGTCSNYAESRRMKTEGQRSFRFDPDIVAALKAARAWTKFRQFPPLYQRSVPIT